MATVNTKIESLKVTGQTLTATLSSTNSQAKFEIMLDGWGKWREVSKTFTLNDLNAGDRLLSARSYSRRGTPDSTPATRTFTVLAVEEPPPPPPPPPPEGNWQTVKVYKTLADWNNNKLIEGLDGATITETGGDIRYFVPGPQTGERCETQIYIGKEGQKCAYDYSFVLPAATRLSEHYNDPKNIISQHHGNKNAGYTGGVSVYPDGRISLQVKGGKELSMSGSHPYEYEEELFFGKFQRDVRNHVRLEILWKRDKTGFARAQLNGGSWAALNNVPTWPVGDADGVESTVIMYRHGWYPQGGYVEGDMDIRFGPLTFQLGT